MAAMLHKLLLMFLVGWLSHVPLPWLHTHMGLSGITLKEHLRLFHASSSNKALPQGWHMHLIVPQHGLPRDEQPLVLASRIDDSFVEALRGGLSERQWLANPFTLHRLTTAHASAGYAHNASVVSCTQRLAFLCLLLI